MTVLTHICRLNVGRVLARRVRAVVAGSAISSDIDMIEIRRRPRDCTVTIIAIVSTIDVGRVFTRRNNAIMASRARSQDLRVIDHDNRRPDIR